MANSKDSAAEVRRAWELKQLLDAGPPYELKRCRRCLAKAKRPQSPIYQVSTGRRTFRMVPPVRMPGGRLLHEVRATCCRPWCLFCDGEPPEDQVLDWAPGADPID